MYKLTVFSANSGILLWVETGQPWISGGRVITRRLGRWVGSEVGSQAPNSHIMLDMCSRSRLFLQLRKIRSFVIHAIVESDSSTAS